MAFPSPRPSASSPWERQVPDAWPWPLKNWKKPATATFSKRPWLLLPYRHPQRWVSCSPASVASLPPWSPAAHRSIRSILGSSAARGLLQKSDALYASNLKTLSATLVLAHHHVVAAQHVRLRLGKFGTIAIVRARRKTFLFRSHQPLDFIFRRLMAMRTTQICRLLVRLFFEKFPLIHRSVPSAL